MELIEQIKKVYDLEHMDKRNICLIANLFLNKKGLTHYIDDIKINDDIGVELGNYDPQTKIMTIYTNNIVNHTTHKLKYSMMFDNEYSISKLTDLMVLKVLLHELTHVEQTKIADTDNGFKGELFRKCNKISDDIVLYLLFYQMILSEYNANIESLLYINKINMPFASICQDNAYNYYKNSNIIISPYQKFTILFDIKNKIPEMSLHNKVAYGLPVTKNEKIKVLELIKDNKI